MKSMKLPNAHSPLKPLRLHEVDVTTELEAAIDLLTDQAEGRSRLKIGRSEEVLQEGLESISPRLRC